MQITAMRATRRAYSTSDAPRSLSKRARSQVARISKLVMKVVLPVDVGSRTSGALASCPQEVSGGPPGRLIGRWAHCPRPGGSRRHQPAETRSSGEVDDPHPHRLEHRLRAVAGVELLVDR